jgi:hypothetical protein
MSLTTVPPFGWVLLVASLGTLFMAFATLPSGSNPTNSGVAVEQTTRPAP